MLSEPEDKGGWFSKPPDLLEDVVVTLVTPGGATETNRERVSGEPGAARRRLEAWVKDLCSDGWQKVGDQSIEPWQRDITLVREIQNQDTDVGGKRNVSQSPLDPPTEEKNGAPS